MTTTEQPANDQVRAETGPMSFGDDWPGVFVRGDNAFAYAMSLDSLIKAIDDGEEAQAIDVAVVKGLVVLLTCSMVKGGQPPIDLQKMKAWAQARAEESCQPPSPTS